MEGINGATKIAEGSEADIYESVLLGSPTIIKYRRRKPYLISEIEEEIRVQRNKAEALNMNSATMAGARAPKLLLFTAHSIFMTKVTGIQMARIVQGHKNFKPAVADSGKMLSILHANDIAHGDYTPANIIVDSWNRAWIIDFGLSQRTNSEEDKAFDLLLFKRAVDKDSYKTFVKAYSKNYSAAKKILERLSDIERRGRYQSRTMAQA